MKYAIHDAPLPAKCPVVFLPGIDGTGRLIHRQRGLAERFALRCASYPQDDRHTYADLVRIALRHLDDTGPAVVLAESFGGAVALMATLERPDLVRRLVLVNTFAWYPRRFVIELLGLIGPWIPAGPSPPSTRPVRAWFLFAPGSPSAEQEKVWELTDDVPGRAYGHRFRLIRDLDLRPRLGEIDVPALVFAAPNDRTVPAAGGRVLARRLPRAKLIETPTGHAGMVDPRVDVAAWLERPDLWAPGDPS